MANQYMNQDEARVFNSCLAAAGYNISTLAKELGMSRATLSSRINGRTDFTRTEMERISTKLKKPPEVIFYAS